MTTLPEKNLLSGDKLPRTTTGEMKEALGKLRDYLGELLGEDSSDKEKARQALGIDLMQWAEKIEAKADPKDIESAMATKADKTELESRVLELEDVIAKRGTPVGSIEYFALTVPPAGYLKADGAAVGRETYPELFAAIGTTFGEGDGATTFNLPDLIGRFAQGSNTPGQKIEAGLPNITGAASPVTGAYNKYVTASGALVSVDSSPPTGYQGGTAQALNSTLHFDASLSSPIYGASNTVQPPALTLLPCIKAFDTAVNPGLIDITELAQEMANKTDRNLSNVIPDQSFKDATVQWGMPDYSAGLSITISALLDGFTAPSDGIFCCHGYSPSKQSIFKVNENVVSGIGGSTAGPNTVLSEGDVLTVSLRLDGFEGYFYPLKGTV